MSEEEPVLDYASAAHPVQQPNDEFLVGGIHVTCKHCSGRSFSRWKRSVETYAAVIVPLYEKLDFYVCNACGHVELFVRNHAPSVDAPPDPSPDPRWQAIECPRCNMVIPVNHRRCTGCGWTRPEIP